MQLRNIGYACINLSLGKTTNKTFRLKNLSKEKYLETVSYNLDSLKNIILWNAQININFFRIGSEIIPFASHKDFVWDWKKDFKKELNSIKNIVRKRNIRLSMHPGQYTVLNSPNHIVVENAVNEINYHSEFLNTIYPEKGKIVIHAGGVYGNIDNASKSFIHNFYKLSDISQKMLVIENDDKSYDIKKILEICSHVNCPAVFDMLHHICNGANLKNPYLNLNKILSQVKKTWKNDIPIFHFSSRKKKNNCSHSDYINDKDFIEFIDYLKTVNKNDYYDIMIEAKMKDKAVLKILNNK